MKTKGLVLLGFFLITFLYYSLTGEEESAIHGRIFVAWLVVAGFIGEWRWQVGLYITGIAAVIPLIAAYAGLVPTPFFFFVMAIAAILCLAGVVPAQILRMIAKSRGRNVSPSGHTSR